MTVNGYVARENDETPWSDAVWDSYYEIAKKFKAIVLGRRTYEIMKEVNEFEKIGNPFTVIVTEKNFDGEDNFFFVKSPGEAIDVLKKKGFEEVLIAGGGTLNSSFMKESLIDELILDIEPLVFGKGIKLFSENDFEASLKLIESKNLSGNTIQLKYKINK